LQETPPEDTTSAITQTPLGTYIVIAYRNTDLWI